MERSLDGLIDFLLEEIALSGEKGVKLPGIVKYAASFYNQPDPQNSLNNTEQSLTRGAHHKTAALIDRAFLEKLWTWLGQHPDVLLGRNAQYNKSTLIAIDQKYTGCVDYALNVFKSQSGDGNQTSSVEHVQSDATASAAATKRHGPSVYATRDRMYLAICGHLPDPTRVFPSEWSLLSYIAAARYEGILQGELGRIAGQDKRSVPKRTDQMQLKGYVVKRTAYLKGTKTSRLFLRRFTSEGTRNTTTSNTREIEKLTIKYQVNQMFEVLKNNPLITQQHLAESLKMLTPSEIKVLSLLIRHFSRAGCIKRVKTAFGPSAQSGDVQLCVKFLREPKETDWKDDSNGGIDFTMSLEDLARQYEGPHNVAPDLQLDIPLEDLEVESETDTTLERVIPQWNPDRILANVLFETARQIGANGMKNIDARQIISGPFVKRILESLLIKISYQSLHSQPVGVKNLTILRSKEASESILQYVHYTIEDFEAMVREGKATWKDIEDGEKLLKQLKLDASTSIKDLAYPKDKFGFPLRAKSTSQVRNGEVKQLDLIRQAKIKDIQLDPEGTSSEGVFSLNSDADHVEPVVIRRKRGRPRKSTKSGDRDDNSDNQDFGKQLKRDPTGQVIRGRPRKFLRGTEKFWRDMFVTAARQENSDDIRSIGTSGLTKSNVGGQELFLARPQNFDETLLSAMSAGLPVPRLPQDITEQWVAETQAILGLSEDGLYFTQTGVQKSSKIKLSKLMIMKSARLKEVDFTDRQKSWTWQSISSSASHSFRYKPYYARLEPQTKTTGFLIRSPKPPKVQKPGPVSGPPRGTFYENIPHANDHIVVQSTFTEPVPPKLGQQPPGDISDSTDTDPDLSERIAQADTVTPAKSPSSLRQTPPLSHHDVSASNPGHQGEKSRPQSTRPSRNRRPTEKAMQSRSNAVMTLPPSPPAVGPGRIGSPDIQAARNQLSPARVSIMGEAALPLDNITLSTVNSMSDPQVVLDIDQVQQVTTENDEVHQETALPELHKDHMQEVTIADNEELRETDQVQQATAENRAEPSEATLSQLHEDQVQPVTTEDTEEPRENTTPNRSITERSSIPGLQSLLPIPSTNAVDNSNQNDTTVIQRSASQHSDRPYSPTRVLEQSGESRNVTSPNPLAKKRSIVEDSSEESDVVRPPKRKKTSVRRNRISQRGPAKQCRNIIYDLIKLCSGLAPSDAWTFRRAMTARWAESGIDADPPTAKHVRTNLRALASGAKVKHITFAYRSKSGAMVTKSIIALRKFDSTSPEVLNLQKKMADSYPEDYVPPEMAAEFDRAPSTVLGHRSVLTESSSDDEGTQESSTPRKVSKPTKAPQNQQASSDDDNIPINDLPPTSTAFLTLKIPGLRSLNLPAESDMQYKPPAAPVLLEPPVPPASARSPDRRTGLRKRRVTRFNAETHNIVWVDQQQLALPASLDEIPNIRLIRDEAAISEGTSSNFDQFLAEVNCVAKWEAKTDELAKHRTGEFSFINHTLSKSDATNPPLESSQFESLIHFDSNGEAHETNFPAEKSWPRFVDALHQTAGLPLSAAPGSRKKRKYTKRNKSVSFYHDNDDDFVVDDNTYESDAGDDANQSEDNGNNESDEADGRRNHRKPIKRRRRARTRRRVQRNSTDKAEKSRPNKKFSRRPVQVVRYMPEDMQYRTVVSVIIIRTLAGGVEKFIDWRLVKRLLPKQEDEHIQVAWKSLSNRHRADVNGLTESLQDKYLDALAEGKVPSVNFDFLDDTDWEGILNWALTNLEKFEVETIDDLPGDVDTYLKHNHIFTEEPENIRNTLSFGLLTSQYRRDELMSGIVFGTKMRSTLSRSSGTSHLPGDLAEDMDLSCAKSWILALLLTPEATYNPSIAHNTLLRLAATPPKCEALVDKALSSLQRDKTITRIKDTSRSTASITHDEVSGVRIWQVSAKYYEQFNLRRQITGSMLKTAAKYKLEVLDTAFSQNQPVTIGQDFASDDGEMVAIVNLIATGAVKIQAGPDLPDTRYGLDWENQGYSTRLIDKATLGFSVVLEPVPYAYDYGNPLDDPRSRIAVPRGEVDDNASNGGGGGGGSLGRIPPWFDINLDFLPEMWDMFLGAVVGLISIRPGADVRELSKSVSNALGEWEVGMIVRYLEDAGAVRKTRSGHGFETDGWWWMVLASSVNDDDEVDG